MALIVETGAGLADAESYVSVDQADQYHADRGNPAAWSGLDVPTKEAKLRAATEYLGQRFAGRWKGHRTHDAQALDWPRASVCIEGRYLPADAVPLQVERACCELALKAVSAPLFADEAAQVKSEKVGPIEVVYADGARQQTRFSAVEAMVSQLLGSAGNSISVTRA